MKISKKTIMSIFFTLSSVTNLSCAQDPNEIEHWREKIKQLLNKSRYEKIEDVNPELKEILQNTNLYSENNNKPCSAWHLYNIFPSNDERISSPKNRKRKGKKKYKNKEEYKNKPFLPFCTQEVYETLESVIEPETNAGSFTLRRPGVNVKNEISNALDTAYSFIKSTTLGLLRYQDSPEEENEAISSITEMPTAGKNDITIPYNKDQDQKNESSASNSPESNARIADSLLTVSSESNEPLNITLDYNPSTNQQIYLSSTLPQNNSQAGTAFYQAPTVAGARSTKRECKSRNTKKANKNRRGRSKTRSYQRNATKSNTSPYYSSINLNNTKNGKIEANFPLTSLKDCETNDDIHIQTIRKQDKITKNLFKKRSKSYSLVSSNQIKQNNNSPSISRSTIASSNSHNVSHTNSIDTRINSSILNNSLLASSDSSVPSQQPIGKISELSIPNQRTVRNGNEPNASNSPVIIPITDTAYLSFSETNDTEVQAAISLDNDVSNSDKNAPKSPKMPTTTQNTARKGNTNKQSDSKINKTSNTSTAKDISGSKNNDKNISYSTTTVSGVLVLSVLVAAVVPHRRASSKRSQKQRTNNKKSIERKK